ncbi:MAG: Hsp20/alpha crystallin family protein [Alphaproteobacteria bacterium]|nr:Hsp20/alpha crystallin family protein [Alphaproteobacteria bacterium]
MTTSSKPTTLPTMKEAFGAMMSPDEFYKSFKDQVDSMTKMHQQMLGQMQDFWKGFDLKGSDWKGFDWKGFEMPAMPWDFTKSGAGDLKIEDKDGTIEIVADFKGYDPADIAVEVSDDVVTMQARKRSESKKAEGSGKVESEQVASAQYAVRLASRVQLDKATAKVVDGRLQLVLPKAPSEQRKAQRIPVIAAKAA